MLDVDIRAKVYPRDGVPVHVIDRLQFQVASGSFCCLIGPSGCGKTTTLRLILGLDTVFDGRIRTPQPGRVAVVFQEPRLLPWRTVEQNVRLALPATLQDQSLDALFEVLGLTGMRGFYPAELSLGMARRVALARAFAVEPDVLILDEPFVSLDEPTAGRLRTLLMHVWRARPTTTLMVTHNVREAALLADRILTLSARPARVIGSLEIDLRREDRDASAIERLASAVHLPD